jgi:sialidase-1
MEKINVFTGGEGGYVLYRIPGVVVTRTGTVLAYAEGRRNSRSDWGSIDVLLRRSSDGGKTWGPVQHVAHHGTPITRNPVAVERKQGAAGDITINNPVAIVDRQNGAIHFLYCAEYARVFYMRSDDDGKTFSRAVEITSVLDTFRPEYAWRVVATGPGHGIQLTNGRLVVPVWLALGTTGSGHKPSLAATIVSDDHGVTWNRGAIALPDTADWICPSETIAVQLADGRVQLNARSMSKANRRLVTTSPDGFSRWTTPQFHDQLKEPICMASIVRLSGAGDGRRNRILFANPDNLALANGKAAEPGASGARRNLSVKLSYDETNTWSVNKVLEPGSSAYSDLAVLPDGTILCFYERSETDSASRARKDYLTVARFNLEWLTEGKDSLEASR